MAENQAQQKLFDALKQFFREVYDSVRAITGIRIDPEIDMFFRQLTGELPIQMREEAASPSGKYDYKVTKGEKYGFTQEQREHIAKEVIDNMEGSLFSRFKVKDVKGEHPLGGYWKSRQTWWTDEKGKKTKEPEKAGEKYQSNAQEIIKINIPDSKSVLTVHKDPLAIRAMFKDLGISITPKPEYANDMMYQEGIKYDKNGKADINSPEFKKWFGNSKVVDENGKPLVVYHGTPNAVFDEFRTPAYFTTDKKYAEGYQRQGASYLGYKQNASNPDTYAVYLSIKNPFDTRDKKARDLFYKEYYGQRGVGSDISEKGLPDWMEAEDLAEWLEESHPEYDGLIVDEGGTGGYGQPVLDRGVAYLPFSPTQIKSVYNKGTFDESNPNIYYQGDKDLIAVHAAKSWKIDDVLESGQLVAPSISITKKGQNELNKGNFGDVVLVMNPNRIKYNRDNIYNRDIYSPRLPSPVYKTKTYGYIEQSEYERFQRKWEEDPEGFKKQYGETFDEMIGQNPEKYIFEGFDPRTEKRIYKKYTPANLLSYIKKESLLGGESWNYGLSSFLAKMSVQLKNREELRKESWNLTNREEAEEKYDELQKAYADLLYGDIQKYSKFSEVSEEDFADFLKYNYEGHPEKAEEFLKVDEIPDSLKLTMKEFVDEALELPRSYFEAKPMRLVPLSDFVYAITKKGTLTKEQKEKFESYGVEVKEVDSIKDFDFSSLDTGEANDTNAVGVYFQPGFHGGAKKFDKFDLKFIGTGEGAQAHGWGIYIAGNRETAEGYRERITLARSGGFRDYEFFIGDEKLDEETSFLINNNMSGRTLSEAAKGNKEDLKEAFAAVIGDWKRTFVELLDDLRERRDFILANPKMSLAAYAKKHNDSRTKQYIKNAREIAKSFNSRASIKDVLAQLEEAIKIYEGYYNRNLKNAAALEAIDLDKLSVRRDEGQLYEVEIPENDVLLDEQKQFADQPEKVKEALLKLQKDYPDVRLGHRGLWIYKDVVREGPYETEGENKKWASQTLLSYGIEGITYNGFQDGRCYVIFDDKAVRIRQTFYQTDKAQRTGAKAADPKPSKERIASDLDVIRNNGVEKYQPKSRVVESVGNFAKHILISVRQRAGAIDNKLKAFFDKLDYFQPNLEKKFASKANGFVKKFQGLTEDEKNEFDYYVYNQCFEELQNFLKEKGMANEYQEVRQLLNFIYAISNQAGIDMGFIEEYFPTSMIDYAGFLDYLKGTDKWSYIAKALREADPEGMWSDKEKADAINKLLRGYRLDPVNKPSNAKDRTILYKSPELMKFYEHSDVALIKYLQGMSQALAINKAFGKGKGFNTDETIGAIVLDLINNGTITNKEEAEVKRLLKSRLSYGATPEFIAMVKNIGYLQTMNNVTSAITQLGDLYAPFYKYSFGTALEAIFGKSEITKTDLGLDKIWEEFSDSSKTGIAVDRLFKAIGLEKMDGFGKNVAINASLINLRKQAASGDMALTERLAYTFGKDAGRVLADIKEGKVTDDIKILIWADLADTQPIGRSGVPTGYLDNPHGRLFYQLKTFTLNQISLFYADSLVNIQKGIKYHNKTQFLRGVQNGFKLLLLLTAGNAGADVLKNLIMGREIDISDTVVSNLLWNIGVSKYTFYKGKRDGYANTLFFSYFAVPQLNAIDDLWRERQKIAAGKLKAKDTIAVTYLPFGRSYYWWFGGGSTEGKARTAEMKKKAAAKNRRKKKKK